MKKSITVWNLLPLLLVLFLLLPATPAEAQQQEKEKANYELAEDWTTDKMRKMAGSTGLYPRWIEDEDRFWYTWTDQEGTHYWHVDAEEGEKQPLFDRRRMAAELTEMFNRTWNHLELDLDNLQYDSDKELFTFQVDSFEVEYDFNNRQVMRGDTLRDDDEGPDENWASYSPDSTWIAFARDHNLYLMEADDPDSTEYQLTEDGEEHYSYAGGWGWGGDDEDEEEDERTRSIARWFEDSSKLYVNRRDVREVEELWVIDNLADRPELETYKYAMPGDKHIPIDDMQVFDVETKEGVTLNVHNEEWAHTSIEDIQEVDSSDYLYIMRRNRNWSIAEVIKTDTETGESQILWTENAAPYYNPALTDLHVLNEGEDFLWFSERTGWGQWYLYDGEGNLQNRVTDGYFVAGDVVKIDTTGQQLFFEGFGREEGVHPYHAQLYRVNFDGSDMQRLTPENSNHSISESDNGNYFVDTWSTVTTPPRSVLRNGDGDVIVELEETNIDRLEEAGWQAPEPFVVKADDDATDIYGVMWKPFNFDSTKTYPVITYVYPGPQTEPFPTDFSLSSQTSLAQLGFVVVALGNRGGSPIRSKYYHVYGHGNLRDYPLADNRYGIEQLASRHPFIDKTKVGIYGHSGGGFMSTAAMLQHPDFYDVAVSSAGNHDNNVYNLWWSESHNKAERKTRTVKVENDQGEMVDSTEVYFDSEVDANQDLAENLEGHLLLAHGTIDNNVHPANTMRMVDALIAAGKRFDLVMLPGQRHGFGQYNDYFERVRWSYFAEHLLGDYRTEVNMYLPD